MTPDIDLDAYFDRIGYGGAATDTLDTLRALHARHLEAIPFEAIDVLLGRGIDISPGAVDAKLIGAKRGGYCFEQNGLFKRVLGKLGFEVEALAARVRWGAEPDAPLPHSSHMVLLVRADGGTWIADVGFGGVVFDTPLEFGVTTPQETRHGTFRLEPAGRDVLLETEVGDAWQAVYQLSLQPQLDVDFVPRNWYTATHPKSGFVRNLMVSRASPEVRFGLLNDRLSARGTDGATAHEILDADGIERALEETFLLPVEPAWRGIIERAAALGAADRAAQPAA